MFRRRQRSFRGYQMFLRRCKSANICRPYETGLRLNELMTTLESTILVSERIRNLSFVKLSR